MVPGTAAVTGARPMTEPSEVAMREAAKELCADLLGTKGYTAFDVATAYKHLDRHAAAQREKDAKVCEAVARHEFEELDAQGSFDCAEHLCAAAIRSAPLDKKLEEFKAAARPSDAVRRALEPFALIGLDVLKNHPGWANSVFHGEWCGYRLTYAQFEAAAAASIALALPPAEPGAETTKRPSLSGPAK